MACASCSTTLGDGSQRISTILWTPENEEVMEESEPTYVSVEEALAIIFEISPLHMKQDNERKIFQECQLFLCTNCGEVVKALYNAFRHFLQIIKFDGEIAKRLRQLDRCKVDPPKIKRAGRKRNLKIDCIDKEFDPEIKVFESDIEDLSEDETYPFKSNYEEEDSDVSPPDSPVSMDITEEPRSPRPVRNTAARNKDWSSYYKDDFLDDEENETEVTATEAEVEGDDEEIPDKETQEILKQVHVAWQEDKADDLYFDDDSDEDYLPDLDLEYISSAVNESNSKPKRAKAKYARLSKNRKSYECEECGNVFAHELSLLRHMKSHPTMTGQLYPCPSCVEVFINLDLLKRHRRQAHGTYIPYRTKNNDTDFEAIMEQGKKYECPVCQLSFARSDIDLHVEDHHIQNPWSCSDCAVGFPTLAEFIHHKAMFHMNRQRQKCEVCGLEFRSEYHLKRHQVLIHHVRCGEVVDNNETTSAEDVGIESKAQCSECQKTFVRPEKLIEHQIIHGIGDKFKCELCGREFSHRSSKLRHMTLHTHLKLFRCMEDGCEKEFGRRDHWLRHLSTNHGVLMDHGEMVAMLDTDINASKNSQKPKEIECPYCQKMVKRERIRLHLVSHTGEKRHACKICGQKFGLRTTLRTHIQCVHQDLRRYACEFCDKKFKRSNHLKDHLKLHTEADNKPFQCPHCDKSFRRQKNLNSHQVTHIGGKDFICELCGKGFSRMDNMRAHVKSVHQGIQIRKKKTVSAAAVSKKTIATCPKEEEELTLNLVLPEVGAETVIITSSPSHEAASSSAEISIPSTTVPTLVAAKKSYPAKKRVSNAKNNTAGVEIVPSTVVNAVELHEIAPEPGTIVTLSVDPVDVLSAEVLEGVVDTVQIEETAEGAAVGSEFDGQRTTIVELGPGQVFPGQYETTYYQYTYYQQE